MDEYEAQLLVVKQALLVTSDEQQRDELIALQTNLEELLALTRGSEPEATSNTKTPETSDNIDDELQRFQSELIDLEHQQADPGEDQQRLEELRTKYNGLLGEKCSAPHEHSWGALSYHNALICGVDDELIVDKNGILDVRLRVLFTNPTHREMLPCNYFLEGECRFDEVRCRYSHGALVPGASIKDYNAPDFHRLARNCPVLAKLQDRLWHRGRVLCVNFVEQQCRVRLDGQEHKERERDFPFEELFPLVTAEDDDLTSDSEESNETDGNDAGNDSDMDDFEAARQARMVELSLFTFKPTERLGAWEQYTRGIGSKLMANMGYIHGTGLGSDGRGIVTPVSAQILPQGRSLDACMELREAANGDKDYFSVERKLKRAQRRQEAANEKAYERAAKRADVFAFLNTSVLGQGSQQTENANKKTKPNNLQQHSNKTLNVETVRVADDIRRKQRDIAKVQQSLARNATDAQLQKRLNVQLQAQKQELATLQAQEITLCKEQQTRKSKNKMFEF
ncbi:PREDICTED: zinc finger CCCH-type with G patch domain-containing protein [Drosophila arizonae]|uniref:Zinc finger CCCH-type with G patch domain-containing protein n=1 Tax=Drosophila arizonae TaxID=7263 RepID=A0ABM1NVM6_DROAR|nr:PREDICTED: zinc finger CCCH-type with G patch domain-containing protein [Drosophila arizonae]